MRGRIVKQLIMVTMASGLVVVTGCSGSQQQEENLETTEGNEQAANNAEGNENNNLGQDDAAEGNGQENFVDNDAAGAGAQGADANSATADATLNNAGSVPVNTAAATPAPVAGGEGSPVPGGRVRYVKEGGVQAVNAPGGQPVMMIEQGEHPVTWEENGYLKIANGVYVPVDSLSDKGISRPTGGGGWAH